MQLLRVITRVGTRPTILDNIMALNTETKTPTSDPNVSTNLQSPTFIIPLAKLTPAMSSSDLTGQLEKYKK